LHLNENKDDTLHDEDGIFYYTLGKQLYQQKLKSFDHVSIYTYLEGKPTLKKHFEELGGYKSVEDLRSIVNTDNIGSYYDTIAKKNTLQNLCKEYFDSFENLDKFGAMSSQDVYDYFDYKLNNISMSTDHDFEIENLEIDDQFIKECDEGQVIGVGYGKVCKILNYLTLGVPLGDLYMLGAFSGVGKSSFTFGNMIIPMTEDGVKCAVISNEMRSEKFKELLLIHILNNDLNYWGLTRKKLKMGNFSEEQLEMLNKAKAISKDKYGTIKFIKLFDNDMNKVKKTVKKLSKIGYSVFLFDTMKAEGEVDKALWESMLMASRMLFQVASRENVAIICTYQLALHTLNKRFLDSGCLSGSKQIKEVFAEMCYMRTLWEDEYTNESHDCKVYQYEKDQSGKYGKIRKLITLDKEKTYIVIFLDKSRSDETGIQLLYEVDFKYNKWKEIGFCKIFNDRG
jgi:replicative DNA helicase